MKRKSQITVLMIIGLVLFILIGLALYFSKAAVKKKSQQSIERLQESAADVQPIKEFVSSCLDKLAKDAIVLLGKQGGYIYSSQGGTLVDFSLSGEGTQFVNYNGFKVAYNLKAPPKFTFFPYSSEIPDYPWKYFPYRDSQSSAENFDGIFGIDMVPPLTPSGGPHSMQTQIETYIDNNLPKCADFEIFRKQGYGITMAQSKTSVTIGAEDVIAQAKIPITITGPRAGDSTELNNFSTILDVRLRDVYFFAKEMVENDAENIKFDIGDSKNDRDSLSARKLSGVYSNDDVITVSDGKSLVYGQPLQYVFGRKNRGPALYYIKKDTLEFDADQIINEEDLRQGTTFKAEDPDEDALSITIKEFPSGLANFPVKLDRPQIKFRVGASDGQLLDYQDIIVNGK